MVNVGEYSQNYLVTETDCQANVKFGVLYFFQIYTIHIDRKTEDDISQSKVEESTSIKKI